MVCIVIGLFSDGMFSDTVGLFSDGMFSDRIV